MRLLVITSEPGWVEALRALFPAADDIIPADVRQAVQNPALLGAVDACFVAEANTSPWTVETLKQISVVGDPPLFVLTDASRSQWEEAALFAGAHQVFRRPLRAGVIQLAISRTQRRRVAELPTGFEPAPSAPVVARELPENDALALWRDFSRVVGRAGEGTRFVADYLAKLREVMRCSRLILYLAETTGTEKSFRCASAAGVSEREFAAFRLSQKAGVALLASRGAIVSRSQLRPDSARDAAAGRELGVFGVDVAVPIAGGDGLAGLLLVGPRVSGGAYSEHELTLLYHSLEALAPVLANEAVVRRAEREESSAVAVLDALPIACALVSSALRLTEANLAFRTLLGRPESGPLGLDDLPPAWAAAVTAAVQNRVPSARVELDHQLIGAPRKVRLSVRRIGADGASDASFLVLAEDVAPPLTAAQQADAHSIHNLLQRAGEQLSNEFRNALTPVDIMVQLSRDSGTSRSELERLGIQVSSAIHRLRRRIDDLAYLTKSAIIPEPTTVSALLRATRERLDDWLEDKQRKRIVWLNEFSEVALNVDVRAVPLALAELVINAVEASEGRQVTVTAEDFPDAISFRVRNSGVWSPPPESSGFRHRPFVSEKSTGVGLGVEVASRVAENHGGRLTLGPISADTVEAILRIPRPAPIGVPVETRVARTF